MTIRSRAIRAGVPLVLGLGLLAVELWLRSGVGLGAYVGGRMVAFALFLPAAWLCWRGLGIGRAGIVLVLLLAAALRVAAFEPFATPPRSTDVHRYAWDARVQANGINPYRHAPDDPEVAHLRDRIVWPRINLKSWHTVYPPGAEAGFLLARGLLGSSLRATTWLFLLAEAAAVGLLLVLLNRLQAPLERIALVAWHPLAVSEIAGNGHVDALALFAVAALLAAWRARRFELAGAAAALGGLVKLGPFLLVPALARRGGRRFLAAAVALAAIAYLPYLGAGRAVLGSLPDYLERQHFGGSLFWLLSPLVGDAGAGLLLGVALAAAVGLVSLRAHDSVEQVARSGLVLLGGLLLAAGYLQPWHALWLLPFFAVTAAPGWLWLTGALPLLYLFGLEGRLPGWVRLALYGPIALWILWRLLRPRAQYARTRLDPLPRRPRVAAVIPVLDEVEALPTVLREIPSGAVDEVIVVDGGSRDGTREAARAQGARVVREARRGYGRACAAGAAATDADVIVFLDGDGSDDPAALRRVLEPVVSERAALSLGARVGGEPGSQLAHQRLGNLLVSLLMRAVYGLRVRDVPPFRAVRRDALVGLSLRELTYGWPVEMMIKAARAGLPVEEVEVRSRARRGGRSKISGRAGPSFRAGVVMLGLMARYS